MTSMAGETKTESKAEPEHAVEEVAGLDELADALLVLRNRDEAKRFLRDLCTIGELEALAHRWQIARLVDEGAPYLDIAERVRTSTATVTRVAHWLRHGAGGYTLALERTARRRGA
jgi:TrpR-related protein YerC/YecD